MRRNKLKEMRTARGLTVRKLAELADVSHATISLIERHERGLTIPMAERLAQLLEVDAADLAGLADPSADVVGLSECDAAPYEITQSSPIVVRKSASDNIVPFVVRTDALDALGYAPEDVVFVDIGNSTVAALQSGQCVVAQVYSGMAATTVMRQFIAPGLLITNSRVKNEISLRIDIDDVAIKGVIVGQYRGRH